MKKILLVLTLVSSLTFAQTKQEIKDIEKVTKAVEDTTRTSGWVKKGLFTTLFNQSSFDNWLAGGQSNLSINASLNYDMNYKSENTAWDNKLLMGYGITKIQGADLLKSDDRIEFISLYGRKAKGNWYYSGFFNFKSQLTTNLGNNPANWSLPKTTSFFSPAFIQIGPGMLWKKSDNCKVNFAPATSRFIIVMDQVLADAGAFGVDPGDNLRYELGAAISGYYKFSIVTNVTVENILNLYSNYLEDPQNVDLDYQINVAMKINKWLTSNITLHTIYDDNAFRGFQTRQLFGLGFNYGF
ncbi:DUF3078 domain-containing protein [Flavobacterium sp. j3]|uniref:DUF3078 domain-containing protein n=1 Tax=Flavobacterium aureirubrum TaxID=3133147 RepID=A0ABU9N1G1_9FLAO